MDVITETSLAALIQRATDPRNQNPDTTAIEAVCGILNKEPEGAHIAAKLIASKIQSTQEWEALQSLSILEACMKNCGTPFQSEIGKFRFLNEMIKLVSPKYLGAKTPPLVRKQVLQLMYSWTLDYPKETKIKEAYEMLKKQGVVSKEEVNPGVISDKGQSTVTSTQRTNALFQDEEKSKLLQKLLQSKNPDDLQAANRLIKTMVKEDERRTELKSRRITELETVHNNIRLLNEMLDSYKPGQASAEELELIKELHQGCERLRPNVFRLAAETQDNEEMLNQVLATSDELGQVFDKYNAIIVLRKQFEPSLGKKVETNFTNQSSLLDLSTPSEESLVPSAATSDILSDPLASLGLDLKLSQPVTTSNTVQSHKMDLDTLGEIFGSINTQSNSTVHPVSLTPRAPVLQPTQPTTGKVPSLAKSGSQEKSSKAKALEELDVLGKSLMDQCKMDASLASKSVEKVTLNLLTKQSSQTELIKEINEKETSGVNKDDVEFLLGVEERERKESKSSTKSLILNGDDLMVDLTDEAMVNLEKDTVEKDEKSVESTDNKTKAVTKTDIKPLSDLFVSLESVKPSAIPPLNVIEEKNGVSVTLHIAKNTPREDVSVIVVTTISKNSLPLTNYLFQAVIPKSCKMRLQPPSGSELPAHNPFLPPAAITQIMLIANPHKEEIFLKIMISYTMDDETVTEMGEVEKLPVNT